MKHAAGFEEVRSVRVKDVVQMGFHGWEEEEMPTYDYGCRKCGKGFSVTHSIAEHGRKRVRCPQCESRRVQRSITAFFTKTSKKS